MKNALRSLTMGVLLAAGLVSTAQATIYTTLFTNASTLDTTAGGDFGLNFLSGAPTGTFATLT